MSFLKTFLCSALILQLTILPAIASAGPVVAGGNAPSAMDMVRGLEKKGWTLLDGEGNATSANALVAAQSHAFSIRPPARAGAANELNFKVTLRTSGDAVRVSFTANRLNDDRHILGAMAVSIPKNIATEAEAKRVRRQIILTSQAFEAQLRPYYAKTAPAAKPRNLLAAIADFCFPEAVAAPAPASPDLGVGDVLVLGFLVVGGIISILAVVGLVAGLIETLSGPSDFQQSLDYLDSHEISSF